MPYQPRPEAEEEPPRRDTTQRVRTIERWLHHAEEELLYAPDAQRRRPPHRPSTPATISAGAEASWGSWPSLRFPMDARHPLTQQPYGAYAVGEVFPFTYQGQWYQGRVIERLVSRADGLVELHVQAAPGGSPRRKASHGERRRIR